MHALCQGGTKPVQREIITHLERVSEAALEVVFSRSAPHESDGACRERSYRKNTSQPSEHVRAQTRALRNSVENSVITKVHARIWWVKTKTNPGRRCAPSLA